MTRAQSKRDAPRLLYVTPGFGVGGAEVRTTQIISFLGERFQHHVVSLNGNVQAGDRINPAIPVNWLNLRRSGNSFSMLARLVRLVREQQPDLVLTFNWGSIDAVLATILTGTCPVIHTEDGLNHDEALRQKHRRVLFRRLVLPHVYRVIAPSQKLATMMRESWHLSPEKIHYLPNGVDIQRFQPRPQKREAGEIVVGTVGSLTAVKQQDRLIEAGASLKGVSPVKLVLVGSGPEKSRLEQRARALGCGSLVDFWGYQQETSAIYQHFDIFALSSSTEQMPLALLEAMASGLPVVSTDVGDIKHMVSRANQPYVVSTMADFRSMLLRLAAQPELRAELGRANRERCVSEFSLTRMCEAYARLYYDAIGACRREPLARETI